MLDPSLHRPLFLLNRSGLLAGRSSCCGKDRKKRDRTLYPQPNNNKKKGHKGLKRRRNLWSLGRKGIADRMSRENSRQDKPSVEGQSSKVGAVDR